jgi:hypothetical protein
MLLKWIYPNGTVLEVNFKNKFKCCLSSITMDHVKDIQTGYLCVAEVAEAPMKIIRHFKVAIFLRRTLNVVYLQLQWTM